MNEKTRFNFLFQETVIIFVTTVVIVYLSRIWLFFMVPGIAIYILMAQTLQYRKKNFPHLNIGRWATASMAVALLYITTAGVVNRMTMGAWTLPLTWGFAVTGIFILVLVSIPAWIHFLQIDDG